MNLHPVMFLIVSTLLISLQYSHQQIPLSRQYQYNTTLAKDGSFDLFWSIQDGELYIAMSAQTNGWLAVGFNSFVENDAEVKDVDMRLTDMVIGWRDSSGNTYLYDSYAMSNSIPSMDTQLGGTDNSILIQSWETTGRTMIEFKRSLDTKDAYDLAMVPNKKLILLYALSAQDPNNNQYTSMAIHTKRGKVAIPNFWPLQNETLSEKQSNITLSNTTNIILSSNSSSTNGTSSSSNQTSISFPIVTFPQNNNNNNTTNPPPPLPPQHTNNQTIIVIPSFFPSTSSPISTGNNNNVTTGTSKPGKEKPLVSVHIQVGASTHSISHHYSSLFIVIANLFIMQMLLAFL